VNRLLFFASLVFACSPVKGTPLIDAEVLDVNMLQVTPPTGSARIGLDPPLQLVAMASLSDGTTRDVTLYATWSSSDATVASANPEGLVTALHPGTAMITATMKGQSASTALTVRDALIAVADRSTPPAVDIYDAFTTGSGVAPLRSISGSATLMTAPFGVAVDGDELFDAEQSTTGILVYSAEANGNVAPLRQISGSATGITAPLLAIQVYKHEIYVSSSAGSAASPGTILVFPEDGSGNIPPSRMITGSNTNLDAPFGMTIQNDLIYVSNQNGHGIDVFPTSASGDVAPLREIAGSATELADPLGLAVVNNELYAADLANWITVFPADATGNVPPTRWLHGPNTGLLVPVGVTVIGHTLVCTQDQGGGVYTYPLEATENQPPTSTFTGSASFERLGIAAF